MIKLERTDVMNFENAMRGARNPMNSWYRMDSTYDENGDYVIGENDLSLAQRLAKAGSDHRKYLRQIFVSVDVTAPLYWWKEYDTYKVGTTANSCSTMHKIHANEFALDDFSHEHLITPALEHIENIIQALNDYRYMYLNWDDESDTIRNAFDNDRKNVWWQMIQLLPSSYNQMRTCTLTYENLINIYHARRNHKLTEWHTYCDWIETLPYFKEICLGGESNGE